MTLMPRQGRGRGRCGRQAGKAGNGALNALNYKLNAASAAPGHGLDFTNERLAVVAGQWQEQGERRGEAEVVGAIACQL